MMKIIWTIIGILILVHAYFYIRYQQIDPCAAALTKVEREDPAALPVGDGTPRQSRSRHHRAVLHDRHHGSGQRRLVGPIPRERFARCRHGGAPADEVRGAAMGGARSKLGAPARRMADRTFRHCRDPGAIATKSLAGRREPNIENRTRTCSKVPSLRSVGSPAWRHSGSTDHGAGRKTVLHHHPGIGGVAQLVRAAKS